MDLRSNRGRGRSSLPRGGFRGRRGRGSPATEAEPRVAEDERVSMGEPLASMPPVDSGVADEEESIIDFGEDKDMKHLLRSIQPKSFTEEGTDVPRALDEWITSMEDYFALAGYNELAKRVMAHAKLEGGVKTW